MSNGEAITIIDHFDATYNDMEQIQFADGTVLDAQAIRDKTVADMKATGSVIGSQHTETYRHALGDGSYTITDYAISSSINDRLILTDLNAAQVSFAQNAGEDLVITTSNGEAITITNHFDGTYYDMEQIQFADGTVLDAQAIRDKTVADMKTTGVVIGSQYAETYRHALGDGSYTIKDYSITSAINDRLILTDLNTGDVTFWKNLGDDLVITMSNGEAIIIADHFDGTYYDMEQIQFADGTVLDTQDILDKTTADAATLGGMTIVGTSLADVLYGGTSDDFISGLGGNDTISAGTGNDTLDGGVGADSMIGGAGDDVFIVDDVLDKASEASGGGNDLVQSSASTFTLGVNIEHLVLTGTTDIGGSGNSSANTITGNSGANLLFGSGGNDTLIGNGGNDTLDGGTGIGADQFVFTSTTSGIDVIADFNELDGGSEEGDVLRFDGLKVGTFVYLGTSAFSGGSDNSEARVSGNQVLFDADGDGAADITITLTGLTAASQLAATDFLFV